MQQALQYPTGLSATSAGGSAGIQWRQLGGANNITTTTKIEGSKTSVRKLVSEIAVIVFARRGCCMCHALKRLLHALGVNPTIYDVDEQDEADVINELSKIIEGDNNVSCLQFPEVFIGGKLFGGVDKVMATHISGELVPLLREARALWL